MFGLREPRDGGNAGLRHSLGDPVADLSAASPAGGPQPPDGVVAGAQPGGLAGAGGLRPRAGTPDPRGAVLQHLRHGLGRRRSGLQALARTRRGVEDLRDVRRHVQPLHAHRGRPRLRGNQPASRAGTILLVGSEGGSTWGFAATLRAALTSAGETVHIAPMSAFDPARYAQARRILLLTATYGDGAAPASARGFLARLARADARPGLPLAVLGFGDRSFPAYCGFARSVSEAAAAQGWPELLPPATVDRQSPQDFARWGRDLGAALGFPLELAHQPERPAAAALTLVSRRDYGTEVGAPTAILRFALPQVPLRQRLTGRGFGRFHAGDLLGILSDGAAVPRFYSLASGRRDGFIEIVVRKHPGGLCSGQLHALAPGDSLPGFLRPNPGFRTGRGTAPLILIGAGTGIGPLAGFIRGNAGRRAVHLFFGMRHPGSDFLYGGELPGWQADGRLARIVTAVSRRPGPRYVQDALRAEGLEVARLIREGARIMVCGGRDMAAGVTEALTEILAPSGLSPVALKAEGRYVEDIY